MRILVATTLTLMLGACGSTASAAGTDLAALGRQLAQCYRDNGLTAVPDPTVVNGKLQLSTAGKEALAEYGDAKVKQAQQACAAIAAKLPEGAIEDDPARPTAGATDIEAVRAHARCMRENGVPEWPDPRADGSLPLKGSALQKEGRSRRISAAMKICSKYWSGNFQVS